MKQKNGYDQFFKKAQAAAQDGKSWNKNSLPKMPKINVKQNSNNLSDIELLRLKILNEKKQKNKRKIKIPWKLAGFSFLGLILTFFVFENFEKVEKFISKVEIHVLGSAIGAESVDAAKNASAKSEGNANLNPDGSKKEDGTAKTAGNKSDGNNPTENNKKEWSQEEINHFAKLNERKKELDARESELNRIENELTAQKEELEKRMKELEKTRTNISSVLEEKVKADNEKIETLVQMYSTMKPQQAAKVFETLDEDLSVEIISRMKKKNAA